MERQALYWPLVILRLFWRPSSLAFPISNHGEHRTVNGMLELTGSVQEGNQIE